jgi:drug/metabolite transporter (DMT)-like permease
MPHERTNRLKGMLLMVAAGLCWSTGGIIVRSVTVTDAWEIVFWRALFMVLFVGAFLTVRYGSQAVSKITAVGFPGLLAGALLASSFFLFILSVMRTTVANSLVLMSTSPFVAALFGRLFLNEHVPRRTYIAMTAGLAGIALMFADALGSGGALSGNLLACGVPLAFGANIIILRRMGASVDMVPTVLLAGLIALPIALPMGWPLTASGRDVGMLAVMGMFQLGLGCLLMTLAAPHLSAAEIGLLSLLETILGPLWVWMGIGERPSESALLGGMIVISALVVNTLAGLRRGIPAPPRSVLQANPTDLKSTELAH